MESLQNTLEKTNESMTKAFKHLEEAIVRISVSKVHPDMLKGVHMDYHGVDSPVAQLASISVQGGKTLVIKPWESKLVPTIERAVFKQNNFGLVTKSDEEKVYAMLPVLAEETREKFAKQLDTQAEQGKVVIRNLRKHAKEAFKQTKAEDEVKRAENELQKLTDKWIALIDKLQREKKEELMKV